MSEEHTSTYDSPLEEIRGILEKSALQDVDPAITNRLTKNSSISSEKMLLNYMSDSPRIFHTTLKDIFGAHIAVHTQLSDGFKKATPIILILGAVMVAAIVMGNSGTLVDAIAKNTGIEKRIEVSQVVETRIVYLTPEEAAAQGIAVEDTPAGIDPDIAQREGEDLPLVNPIPDDVVIGEDEAFGNQRTEGFDIVGNLAPSPIPFTGGSNTNVQKSCDDGFQRKWTNANLAPDSILNDKAYSTAPDGRSFVWLCLNIEGYENSLNPETEELLEENIGTYEVR